MVVSANITTSYIQCIWQLSASTGENFGFLGPDKSVFQAYEGSRSSLHHSFLSPMVHAIFDTYKFQSYQDLIPCRSPSIRHQPRGYMCEMRGELKCHWGAGGPQMWISGDERWLRTASRQYLEPLGEGLPIMLLRCSPFFWEENLQLFILVFW